MQIGNMNTQLPIDRVQAQQELDELGFVVLPGFIEPVWLAELQAATQKAAWDGLTDGERDAIVEFLKTLQVLPEKTKHLIVDPKGKKKKGWPDFPYDLVPHLTP